MSGSGALSSLIVIGFSDEEPAVRQGSYQGGDDLAARDRMRLFLGHFLVDPPVPEADSCLSGKISVDHPVEVVGAEEVGRADGIGERLDRRRFTMLGGAHGCDSFVQASPSGIDGVLEDYQSTRVPERSSASSGRRGHRPTAAPKRGRRTSTWPAAERLPRNVRRHEIDLNSSEPPRRAIPRHLREDNAIGVGSISRSGSNSARVTRPRFGDLSTTWIRRPGRRRSRIHAAEWIRSGEPSQLAK